MFMGYVKLHCCCKQVNPNILRIALSSTYHKLIGDLIISTVEIAIMRSRFVTGILGCSNNRLCMISRRLYRLKQGVLKFYRINVP